MKNTLKVFPNITAYRRRVKTSFETIDLNLNRLRSVSPNNKLFGDTVSPNNELFGDTVSPNNFFHF